MRATYDIEAYLKEIARLHPQIAKFFRGPFDRYMDLAENRMEWPVLWMEDPTIKFSGENTNYSFNLQLLIRSKEDNWEEQNLAMARAEIIMIYVMQKLMDDAEDGRFNMSSSQTLVPITGITHSHDVGYQSQISIDNNMHPCTVPTHTNLQQEIFVPHAIARVDGQEIFFEELAEYEYSVGIYDLGHTEIDTVADSPETVDITAAPRFFYLTLTYTIEGQEYQLVNLIDKQSEYFPLINETIIQ